MEHLIWKTHPRYKGNIEVTNTGLVRSLTRKDAGNKITKGVMRKQHLSSKGYLNITVRKNNKARTESIHRLVAETFIPNPLNKPFINHKNGIKTDNRTENLEWCTGSENQLHSIKSGLTNCFGINHPGSKFTKEQVEFIYTSKLFYWEFHRAKFSPLKYFQSRAASRASMVARHKQNHNPSPLNNFCRFYQA